MYLTLHSFSLKLCSATIDLKHSAVQIADFLSIDDHDGNKDNIYKNHDDNNNKDKNKNHILFK